MCLTLFTSVRPYYIVPAKREECLCRYHLGALYFAETLNLHMKRVVDGGICKCGNPNPPNAIELKRAVLCPKPEGAPDKYACISGNCNECKDFKRALPRA